MCLIILANDIKSLSMEDLKIAYKRNSEGFGVMYLNKNKEFISDKFVPNKFTEVENFFNLHKEQINRMAIHFRLTTEGKTNKKNCHPFISYKSDNRIIGMMHNGARLPINLTHKNCSDTWHYNHYLLKPRFLKNPNKILETKFQKALSYHINSDKMIFLDSQSEKFIIINENLGNYKGANWFSNDYWNIPKFNFSKINYYGNNSFDYNYLDVPTDEEIINMTTDDIYDFVCGCFENYNYDAIVDIIQDYKLYLQHSKK